MELPPVLYMLDDYEDSESTGGDVDARCDDSLALITREHRVIGMH